MSFYSLLRLTVLIFILLNYHQSDFVHGLRQYREYHTFKTLDNSGVAEVASMSNMTRFKDILTEILLPRVVGSPSHERVKKYIINQMNSVGWTIESDAFTDETPTFGVLKFENIIARLNPAASRYLVLACHYDSKYMREGEFFGATDSAVPCAMMIDLAHALKDKLEMFKKTDLSVMFIFFDGEEAFQRWGPKDSIYGARHLARKWSKSVAGSATNELDKIDLLVLLDLLGAANPNFYSYFQKSEKFYRGMISAEKRLSSLSLMDGYRSTQKYFQEMSTVAHIEDDHIPFLERDVPILHIIPLAFPDVWHTPDDNWRALDFNTIDNLNKIFRIFVLEYLYGYKTSS